MRKLILAAALAAGALSAAACSSTGIGPSPAAAAQTVVQDQAQIRTGVEQGFAATAASITTAAHTGIVDPAKVKTLRTDLMEAYAALQVARTAFTFSGAPGSDALTKAAAAADAAYATADQALSAAGG